jgi:hypothetical protein
MYDLPGISNIHKLYHNVAYTGHVKDIVPRTLCHMDDKNDDVLVKWFDDDIIVKRFEDDIIVMSAALTMV